MAGLNDYYVIRQCRAPVRRSHRFLWWTWDTSDYEYGPHAGVYYAGPFSHRLATAFMVGHPHDRLITVDQVHPDLLKCMTQAPRWARQSVATFFSAAELKDPAALLEHLREIWAERST